MIGRAALLLAALLVIAAGPVTPHVLREQAWTAGEGRDLAYALTHAPGECLAANRTESIERGRALFRSPILLGGPAGRLGLSCNACHSNGRVNARFFLPELTDRRGAADVTSEWASHVRGDGVMNPVDIPDLVDVSQRTAFGHGRDPSIEHFVHGVMVEEFQGQEPSPAVQQDVMAYLTALETRQCAAGDVAITLQGSAEDVRRALSAGGDWPTQRLLLGAAQDGIGRIVERLPARWFARERRRLEALSRELTAVRHGETAVAWDVAAPGWRVRFDAVVARIAWRERRTYFNETTLRRALGV